MVYRGTLSRGTYIKVMFKERSKRGFHKKECSKCNGPLEGGRIGKYRYCLNCHAEESREYRARKKEELEKLRRFYKFNNG